MKLHYTPIDASTPHHMYSCASRVISYLTKQRDADITMQVMQMRRCHYKWNEQRLLNSTEFIYDTEIRWMLHHLLHKTRMHVPKRTITVEQLSKKLKRNECTLVMVHMHILIVHNACIYDVHNFGTPASQCTMWKKAKVKWYQRLKE